MVCSFLTNLLGESYERQCESGPSLLGFNSNANTVARVPRDSSDDDKAQLVSEALLPWTNTSAIACAAGLNPSASAPSQATISINQALKYLEHV